MRKKSTFHKVKMKSNTNKAWRTLCCMEVFTYVANRAFINRPLLTKLYFYFKNKKNAIKKSHAYTVLTKKV